MWETQFCKYIPTKVIIRTKSRPAGKSAGTSKKAARPPRARTAPRATQHAAVSPSPRGAIVRRKPLDVDAGQYAIAYNEPFSEHALGARVPGLHSIESVTYCAKGRCGLQIANGAGALLFTPNPILSAVDLGQMLASAPNMINPSQYIYCIASPPTVNATKLVGGASNSPFYGAVTNTLLSAQLGTYRTVGAGLKISSALALSTVPQRVIIAPVPFSSDSGVISDDLLNGPSSLLQPAIQVMTGILPAALSSAGVLNMPGAFEFTTAQLYDKELVLPFRVSSEAAFDMRLAASFISGVILNEIVGQASAFFTSTGVSVASQSAELGPTSNNGWVGWVVYCEPISGSLPTGAVIDVEYIYHLEGSPNLASTIAFLPDTKRSTSAADPSKIVAQINLEPPVKVMKSLAADMFAQMTPIVKKAGARAGEALVSHAAAYAATLLA